MIVQKTIPSFKGIFLKWRSIVRTLFCSQNVEALSRYTKLFNEFLPSLKNVQDFLQHVPNGTKRNLETKLKNVIKEWKNLQHEMVQIIKVSNPVQIASQFFVFTFNPLSASVALI